MDDLPDDVLGLLIEHSPDYDTLYSFVQVSKRFYALFQERPQTIARRVAWNLVGLALPQAMRAIRHPIPAHSHKSVGSDTDDSDDEGEGLGTIHLNVDASVETVEGPPLLYAEQRELEAITACARKLEDYFSHRYKDRASTKSKLNSRESWRFRRAIFRLMVFSKIFSASLHDKILSSDDQQRNEAFNEEYKGRKAFFTDIYTEELVEIDAVSHFLEALVLWSTDTGGSDGLNEITRALVNFGGPLKALQACETESTEPLYEFEEESEFSDDEEFLSSYISGPLKDVWERRKVTPPIKPNGDTGKNTLWYSILEFVQEHDKCTICYASGTELWNESNWHFVSGLFNPAALKSLLKGNLRYNSQVQTCLLQEFREIQFDKKRHEWSATFLDEMFAMESDECATRDKGNLLCVTCLQEYVSSHLHIWLLRKMRVRGTAVYDDCWWGYNCRTQTHNYAHATKLNHLCPQTRF